MLTFPLKTLFPEETDERQEFGDLFEVHHCGVVEVDDGHGFFIVRRTGYVLTQADEEKHEHEYGVWNQP